MVARAVLSTHKNVQSLVRKVRRTIARSTVSLYFAQSISLMSFWYLPLLTFSL